MKSRENVLKTIKLLKDYKLKIDEIGNYKYPATSIINFNMNRFYDFIIISIKTSIDVDNDKMLTRWNYVADLLELIKLLRNNLNEINNIKLWSSISIMEKEKKVFNDHIGNIEFVEKTKNELDIIKKNKVNPISVFKLDLIEEYLQPSLINLLIFKGTVDEFRVLKAKITDARINSCQEKDEFIFHFKYKSAVNDKKFGICYQDFILKYGSELKGLKEFNFLTIFEKIFEVKVEEPEKMIASMLEYLIHLLEQPQAWNFGDLSCLYLKLSNYKIREFMRFQEISILLNKIEILLSEKIEEIIKNKLGDKRTNEFDDEFDKNVKERIKNIEFNEKVLRKEALYRRILM